MVSRDITKQEDVIYLARNGTAVAQITLIPKKQGIKRIGAAEGKFKVPEMFWGGESEYEYFIGYPYRIMGYC